MGGTSHDPSWIGELTFQCGFHGGLEKPPFIDEFPSKTLFFSTSMLVYWRLTGSLVLLLDVFHQCPEPGEHRGVNDQ